MVLTKLDAHAFRAIVRPARTRSRKQNPLVEYELLTKIVGWILKWFHFHWTGFSVCTGSYHLETVSVLHGRLTKVYGIVSRY